MTISFGAGHKPLFFLLLSCVLLACGNNDVDNKSSDATLEHKGQSEQRSLPQIEPSESLVCNDYVGSERCVNCHQEEVSQWQQSHHAHSMNLPSDKTVLGDFEGQTLTFQKDEYRFVRQDDGFFIEINHDGNKQKHKIIYTFGYSPLQQYLIELDGGHIQALNVAWDSRALAHGGQKWFHLRSNEVINEQSIFNWKRHYQNWNSRCATCHSVDFKKNYQEDRAVYKSTFSDINVACEACHGPAKQHLELASKDRLNKTQTGFSNTQIAQIDWQFQQGLPIAQAKISERNASNQIDMCGGCHSLRKRIADESAIDTHNSYHDNYSLRIVNDQQYHGDGSIREEVFVLGSFLQSKMADKGVTCSNCHNSHTGNIKIKGNGLCAQCHQASVFDTPVHHHHETDSGGAQCVNCHMPSQTYMQVDDRRDHSFSIPRAGRSHKLNAPNACLNCHKEWGDCAQNKLNNTLKSWGIKEPKTDWSLLKHQANFAAADVLPEIADFLKTKRPQMRTAALLESLANMNQQASYEIAKTHLSANQSLVRRAALSALRNMPSSVRVKNALAMTEDPIRSVRLQAFELLLPEYSQLSQEQKQSLTSVIKEYRTTLNLSADSPEGQLEIATFEIAQGHYSNAEAAYIKALTIESGHIPSLLNFADLYRATGQDERGAKLLAKALEFDPQHTAVNFSYAMNLVRQKQTSNALNYFKVAANADDSLAYYCYVYVVALHDQGLIDTAQQVYKSALKRWPNDTQLLSLNSMFAKTGASTP